MAIMQYNKKTPDTLKEGDFALFTKTVSETDITLYAGISGDFAPVHMNEQYAELTRFGQRVAHPMLVGTMAGAAVYRLLSPVSYPLRREFQMLQPVFPGDTVTVRAEIDKIDRKDRTATVSIECYNQKRELVLRGMSLETLDIMEQEG